MLMLAFCHTATAVGRHSSLARIGKDRRKLKCITNMGPFAPLETNMGSSGHIDCFKLKSLEDLCGIEQGASMKETDYDMHLAANSISTDTVAKLFENGFRRDEFANLTYCHTGDYHGTFRGDIQLPSKDLWDTVCGLLEADPKFSGYLEEESCDAEWRHRLNGGALDSSEHLPSIRMIPCPAGRRKSCDIHMAVFLDMSATSAVDYMAALGASSVDRPGPEGIRRVYTITCESLADGRGLFNALYSEISRVPGLHGRMKLEVTTRHYRKPIDATTLPIATKDIVAAWFAECRSRGWFQLSKTNFQEKRDLVLA